MVNSIDNHLRPYRAGAEWMTMFHDPNTFILWSHFKSFSLFFSDESLESGEQVAETEAGKKLKFGAQQGRNALNIAKQKVS